MVIDSRGSDIGRLLLHTPDPHPAPPEDRVAELCEIWSCRDEVTQSILALEKLGHCQKCGLLGGGNIHSNLFSHFGIFWCLLLVFKTHLKAHWAVNLGQSVHEVQFAGHISGTARQGMELEEIQRKSSIKNCGTDTFR